MKVKIKTKNKERKAESYDLFIPENAELPPEAKRYSLSWIWNSNYGRRFSGETAEQYFSRVFSQYNLVFDDSHNEIIAQERTSVLPLRKRYTDLEFRIDEEAGKLVYCGFRDNQQRARGRRVEVEVENGVFNTGKEKPSLRNLFGLFKENPKVVYEDDNFAIVKRDGRFQKFVKKGREIEPDGEVSKWELRYYQANNHSYAGLKKREWPGIKRLTKLVAAGILSWPFLTAAYTASDIALNKPEPVDVKRLILLQKLIDAKESENPEMIRTAVDEFPSTPSSYVTSENIEEYKRTLEKLIRTYTLNGTLPSYDNVLEKIRVPFKLDKLTIIRGRKNNMLIGRLFNSNLDGGFYYGNIIRINEQKMIKEDATTLIKEIIVPVYQNMPENLREEIREESFSIIRVLLDDSRKLRMLKNKEIKLEQSFIRLIPSYYPGLFSNLCFFVNKMHNKKNSYLFYDLPVSFKEIEKLLSDEKLVAEVDECLRLKKEIDRIHNVFDNNRENLERDNLDLKILKPSEIFSEVYARKIISQFGVVQNPENMFGTRNLDSFFSAFKLEEIYPINYRIIDKDWNNFPYLYWLNFSAPVRNVAWAYKNRNLLREEKEDLKKIEKLAEAYGIETWKDIYIPGYTNFKNFRENLVKMLPLLASRNFSIN